MRIQRPRISQPIITSPTITEITSLEGDGANITGSFSGSFVGELTGPTSASFATRISASEASISTLDGSYATDAELTAASGALAGSITTVQTNLDSASGSLAGSITTVQSNLDTASGSLAQSITDNASDISNNGSDITANSSSLAASITTVQSNLDTTSGSLASDITSNTTNISTNASNITSNSSSLAASITTVQSNLDTASGSLASDITSNTTNISTNASNIDTKADIASPTFTGTVSGVTATHVGLGNVTNESKATMFTNAALTGTPTAPTAITSTDTTQVATTAFVQDRIAEVIDSAPAALDTLNELATALGDDPNLSGSLATTISTKLAKDQNLSDLNNAGTALTNLGVSAFGKTLIDDADQATAQTTLGLVIGTDVQAYDAELQAIAGLAHTDGNFIVGNGSTFTAESGATARTSIGLGNVTNESKATMFSSPTFTGTVSGVTATHVGLENVTNESKATMFTSPTFTGDPAQAQSGLKVTNVFEAFTNGNIFGSGTLSINSVNTGQGDNELYAMNQAVQTTDHVEFQSFGVGTGASGTTGEIRATGDITAYYSSDERLKENFTPLTGALDKVKAIGGYEFDWKEGIEDVVSKKGHDIGVKAQELQAQYPELVHERDNGYLAVDYIKLNAVLIEAVKELAAKVEELSK